MISKWIIGALKYSNGTHDFEDVVRGIEQGEFQLFANDRGCVVTPIPHYPRKKVLFVFLAGGDLEGVTDLHEEVIEFAKSRNCELMTMIGRMGWTKALKQHGWSVDSACMTRVI